MAINFSSGPMIPGLGVKYTSPTNLRTQNALNMRATGATAGEANRFAQLAPKGYTTKTPTLSSQDVMDLVSGRATTPANAQGPLRSGYVTGSQAATTAQSNLANKAAAITSAKSVATTPTGALVDSNIPAPDYQGTSVEEDFIPSNGDGDTGGGGTDDTGGGGTDDTGGGGTDDGTDEGTGSEVDVQALYDSIFNSLLDPEFIGFQGDQASELRRLQNLRNQLYGDPEFGTTGSLQRQRDLDARARRRLAAQRAVAGMLQGGAYAGPQRGVGTLQQADQEYGIQEMLRPYREQTASDRLREFGLEYTPDSRVFDLFDFGNADDIMGGWATQTFSGREAAARARRAALEQLTQQGLSL